MGRPVLGELSNVVLMLLGLNYGCGINATTRLVFLFSCGALSSQSICSLVAKHFAIGKDPVQGYCIATAEVFGMATRLFSSKSLPDCRTCRTDRASQGKTCMPWVTWILIVMCAAAAFRALPRLCSSFSIQ
ncbi:hypothetical protein PoB_006016600 [Plakobranchus ocellatus]|uniref:Battenin n=1 Tax=Plakobranchus ocellatus TaxID=259542 RepID=A0AAV4CP66_9GAST|nr:hypothetical protein PoB_006016600 [Plakobranchus ocellatus]